HKGAEARMSRGVAIVMPKPEFLDPQGKAIIGGLNQVGMTTFSEVRPGKRIGCDIASVATDKEIVQARESVKKALKNHLIENVVAAAGQGMPVLGICNAFQILCEAHLLPGALIRNDHQHFICRDQELVVENTATAWTGDYERGQTIRIPLKNGEGGYVATEEVL